MNAQTATSHGDSAAPSLVIFTRVERLLREGIRAASATSRAPLRLLASPGVEDAVRQPALLRRLPGVYVPGAAGWSDAVWGVSQ